MALPGGANLRKQTLNFTAIAYAGVNESAFSKIDVHDQFHLSRWISLIRAHYGN
jgi:hypothetical protein